MPKRRDLRPSGEETMSAKREFEEACALIKETMSALPDYWLLTYILIANSILLNREARRLQEQAGRKDNEARIA